MEVMVRIDGYHGHKGWNWVRGHFLAMDKGTIRGMLGAQVFNIEVPDQVWHADRGILARAAESGRSKARLRPGAAQTINLRKRV